MITLARTPRPARNEVRISAVARRSNGECTNYQILNSSHTKLTPAHSAGTKNHSDATTATISPASPTMPSTASETPSIPVLSEKAGTDTRKLHANIVTREEMTCMKDN